MQDNTKLVETLRFCASDVWRCEGCPYEKFDVGNADCIDRLLSDAADALEESARIEDSDAKIIHDLQKKLEAAWAANKLLEDFYHDYS